jgi:hypothetical protein
MLEAQLQQNAKLDKLAALLLSQQLLTECIDHHGHVRDADTCAEIVAESFSAGLCLLGELEQRNKQYLYQMSEFFLEENDIPEDEDGTELAGKF